MAIEPQKVRQLGRSINLCLPDILALAEHRRSHQLVPILPRDEVRCFQKHGRAVCKGQQLPFRFRCKGGGDCLLDMLWRGLGC